jgi:hypothetical protein
VSCEQRAATINVVQMFQRRPSNRQTIIRCGPTPDLVQNHQRAVIREWGEETKLDVLLPLEKQIDAIGEVDILMIPIGGKYTIDAKEAEKVIGQINPKIIIPMHYKIPGLNIEELAEGTEFAKELGLEIEKEVRKFSVKTGDLRDIQNKVIFMDCCN